MDSRRQFLASLLHCLAVPLFKACDAATEVNWTLQKDRTLRAEIAIRQFGIVSGEREIAERVQHIEIEEHGKEGDTDHSALILTLVRLADGPGAHSDDHHASDADTSNRAAEEPSPAPAASAQPS